MNQIPRVILLIFILELLVPTYCIGEMRDTIFPQIIGRVVYEGSGKPIVGAEVTSVEKGCFRAITDQDGRFKIKVDCGEYKGIIISETTIVSITIEKTFTLDFMQDYDFGEIKVPMKVAVSPAPEKKKIPLASMKKELTVAPRKELPVATKQPPVKTEHISVKVSINLGNPYISLKVGRKWNVEARGAFGSGIKVFSGRILRNFSDQDKNINLFAGAEAGTISFDRTISGKGFLGYAFVGEEYFITPEFALNLDAGIGYLSLTEKVTKIDVAGIEYIVNLGINFYLR